MKKILLLLALTPLLFNSCLKNNDIPDPDPMQLAVIVHDISYWQNALALDPWHIAVRLNSLLIEARDQAGDVEDLTGSIVAESKKDLLGSTTQISYDPANGIYTLRFNGSETVYKDFPRNGVLYIRTNGYATLEEDATWEIYTAKNETYSCLLDRDVFYQINLDALNDVQITYTIRAVSESHFEVNMQHVNVWIDKNYSSDWTANYDISFSSSFPAPSEFKNAQYFVSIDSDYSVTALLPSSYDWQRLYIAQKSDYLPMKYDVGCGKAPVDGELTVSVIVGKDEYGQFVDKDCQISWTPTSTKCERNVNLRYDGYEKTFIVK